jgi:maleate cis-trans isomerase
MNYIAEPEFYRMAPANVTIHSARLYTSKTDTSEKGTRSLLEDLDKDVEKCTRALSTAKVHSIAYACTAGSFWKEFGADKKLIERMEKVSGGIPATTTSSGAIEAFKKLSVAKVALAGPYPEKTMKLMERFFEANGVNVVNIEGLEFTSIEQTLETSQLTVYKLAKRVDRPEAEGVFIACTAFPAIHIIDPLELDLGKPVFTANQCTFWSALRKSGVKGSIEGYGELLRSAL